METILLSINPEYAELILAGTKKYEFRKRTANKAVDRILIYATAPTMQVVGEAEVIEVFSAPPSVLWEQTKTAAGISREKYREYFKGCKTAYAYRLGEIKKYEPPKKLTEFNIDQPPQSFIYIGSQIE